MALNPPLLALAIGAFGIGVTAFTPMWLRGGAAYGAVPPAGAALAALALLLMLWLRRGSRGRVAAAGPIGG